MHRVCIEYFVNIMDVTPPALTMTNKMVYWNMEYGTSIVNSKMIRATRPLSAYTSLPNIETH
jgi:hypothetical protein